MWALVLADSRIRQLYTMFVPSSVTGREMRPYHEKVDEIKIVISAQLQELS
jgi:hypothetical protein